MRLKLKNSNCLDNIHSRVEECEIREENSKIRSQRIVEFSAQKKITAKASNKHQQKFVVCVFFIQPINIFFRW